MQVPILDPQIHIQEGYAPYDQGIAQGVFIRDMTGQPYNGQASIQWPLYQLCNALPTGDHVQLLEPFLLSSVWKMRLCV